MSVYTGSNGVGHHSVAVQTNAAGNFVLSLPEGTEYIGWASTATSGETLYPTAVDWSNPLRLLAFDERLVGSPVPDLRPAVHPLDRGRRAVES